VIVPAHTLGGKHSQLATLLLARCTAGCLYGDSVPSIYVRWGMRYGKVFQIYSMWQRNVRSKCLVLLREGEELKLFINNIASVCV